MNQKKEKYQRYSLLIRWSDIDQKYVVTFPELYEAETLGKTLEQAIRNAKQVIELIVDTDEENGTPIPPPRVITEETTGNPDASDAAHAA